MILVGVDEVGYGSWAGPVVVCAVKSLKPLPDIFRDSKSLSPKKRFFLFQEMIQLWREGSLDLCLSFGSVNSIVEKGILPVTLGCMKNAVEFLDAPEATVLIDGRNKPQGLSPFTKTVIRGDETVPVIGAASIFAKEYRDAFMASLALQYPNYAWHKNKGYGTKKHRDVINRQGITPHHRVNYKPLQKYRLHHDCVVKSTRRLG